MDKNTRFFTPAGGILALICFFLPWMKIDCTSEGVFGSTIGEIHTVSGFDIATKQQVNLITLALVAAAVIIVVSIIMLVKQTPLKSKLPVLISSGVGLGCLMIEYIRASIGYDTGLGKISLEDLGITYQFGAFGTIVGFILSIVGALTIQKSNNISVPIEETNVSEIPDEENRTDTSVEENIPENPSGSNDTEDENS